jgi:antitoxin CptB
MNRTDRLKRLRFRAWHRGTREADLLVGGFFDRHSATWGDEEIARYEALMEEQDVDILAWAMGTQPVPARWEGELMRQLKQVDYIKFPD